MDEPYSVTLFGIYRHKAKTGPRCLPVSGGDRLALSSEDRTRPEDANGCTSELDRNKPEAFFSEVCENLVFVEYGPVRPHKHVII
jgi:hypothetical protein